MSQRLISRSPALKRLQDEGYEVSVRSGHVLIGHVPFRTAEGEIAYGTLASTLELQNDIAVAPQDHVVYLVGGIPYGSDGEKLSKIINSEGAQALLEDVVSACSFSSKPRGGYADYHHKLTTYVRMISEPARALDPGVTATTFPLITDDEEQSVFHYVDTASSRGGISALAEGLKQERVAIVGLGGTGAYILDFLAKTEIEEIHLFDGDDFLQHNAFRAPGAASGNELSEHPKKVEYLARRYSMMRSGIVPHPYHIVEANVDELREMSFAFLTAETSAAKALIPRKLVEFGVPFIDVGMGLYEQDGLGGILRTTTVTLERNEHVTARISSGGDNADDPYARNIQIAELNALNAALAIVRWKKLAGFYRDDEHEHNSLYVVGGNTLINGDVS